MVVKKKVMGVNKKRIPSGKIKGWTKIIIQDSGKDFWIKYRNEVKQREIHIANQSYGKGYYVEKSWLIKNKYKIFKTKTKALIYIKDWMRKHPKG